LPADAAPPAPAEEAEEEDCAICLEKPGVNRAVLDGCRHVFCFDCVTKWAQESCNQCPVCRVRFERVMKAPTRGEPPADAREDSDDEVQCVGVTIARRDQGVANAPPPGDHRQALRQRMHHHMMLVQRSMAAGGPPPNVLFRGGGGGALVDALRGALQGIGGGRLQFFAEHQGLIQANVLAAVARMRGDGAAAAARMRGDEDDEGEEED
jgi:hypothetical protein